MTEPNVRHRWDDDNVSVDSSLAREWRISLHADFEDLLSGASGVAIEGAGFIELAFERGRVLLQAPAGSGKSFFLRSLADTAGSADTEARVIQLSQRDSSDDLWQSQERLEEWLLDELGDSQAHRLLLCLDGLDEVPLESDQRLLRAVEEVTRIAPSCAVLVADRLARRVIRTNRWVLASIALAADSLSGHARSDSSEVVATDERPSPIPVQELGHTLKARLTDSLQGSGDIDELASVILEHWQREGSSHLIERGWLESKISKRNVALLEANDLLWANGVDHVQFIHMLFRAYLAAWALAKKPNEWNSYWFSVVTSKGSNLEALGFLLQIAPADQVDTLVRRVDEWNFYAAMYVLSEDFRLERRATPSLRAALLLLMGRRRFSGVPSTRIQAEDALRLHGGAIAQRLLLAESLQTIVEIAMNQPFTDEWWFTWQPLFVRLPGTAALASDIEALGSEDGVLGWTASNVLLALDIDPSLQTGIVSLARTSAIDNVRWRAVHVLGSLDTTNAWNVCFDLFTADPSPWVRNGALRSLILVTSRLGNEEDRAKAFSRLGTLSANILGNPKWSREIERAVQVEQRPVGWSDSVAILLEDLWAGGDSVEDQDRWRTLSASLRTHWQGAPELGSEP